MSYENIKTINDVIEHMQKQIVMLDQIIKEQTQDLKDARRVSLYGMQRALAGYELSLRTLAWNRTEEQIEKSLEEYSINQTDGSTKSLLQYSFQTESARKVLEDTWKIGLLVQFHFQIDSLFQDIAQALIKRPANPGFKNITEKLFSHLNLPDIDEKLRSVMVAAYIRNSLHNNGFHNGSSLTINLHGMDFSFSKGKSVECASWNHILAACHTMIEIADEVLSSEIVSTISGPMKIADYTL